MHKSLSPVSVNKYSGTQAKLGKVVLKQKFLQGRKERGIAIYERYRNMHDIKTLLSVRIHKYSHGTLRGYSISSLQVLTRLISCPLRQSKLRFCFYWHMSLKWASLEPNSCLQHKFEDSVLSSYWGLRVKNKAPTTLRFRETHSFFIWNLFKLLFFFSPKNLTVK